jgi:diguanylate cyclase (GGDEF)-like protein/PAS domain S-box-containing protein
MNEPEDTGEQALGFSGEQVRAMLAQVHETIILIDDEGVVRFVGGGARQLGGWHADELVGLSMLDLLHPDEHEHILGRMERWTGRAGEGVGPTLRVRTATDDWIDVRVEAVTGPEVAPFAAAVVLSPTHDGDDESQDERLTRIASAFVHLPADRIEDGIRTALAEMGSLPGVDRVSLAMIDSREGVMRTIAEWAAPDIPAFERTHGVVALRDLPSIRALAALETVYVPRVERLPDEWEVERRFWMGRGARSTVAVPVLDQGELVGFIGFEAVRAEQAWEERYLSTLRSAAGIIGQALARSAAELELSFQARHDAVTGLGNRWDFLDRLRTAVEALAPDGAAGLAVVVFDVDRFKAVNDSLGHSAGDELLTRMARRFSEVRRPGDSLARFGGDELILLATDVADPTAAVEVARAMQATLVEPIGIAGHETVVSVSAGVAFTDNPSVPAQDLLRDADTAMYEAKANGRNRVEVFDDALRQRTRHRLRREQDLRRALQQNELEVHYQPELILATREVVGAEALVRWNHPRFGVLAAYEFIDIAEDTGLILEIGSWVLREACAQLGSWQRSYPERDLVMRVNLSARQVGQPDLVQSVVDAIGAAGVEPSSLCLEITETTVMADGEASLQVLEKLRGLGVELAIDDFGTGYSSLSYLKRLPVDVVKIDRSFIDGLGVDADDTAIVTAIVSLAGSLTLGVTAEGVESQVQLDELVRLGCRRAQGYLLGRPEPASAFERRLLSDPRDSDPPL